MPRLVQTGRGSGLLYYRFVHIWNHLQPESLSFQDLSRSCLAKKPVKLQDSRRKLR